MAVYILGMVGIFASSYCLVKLGVVPDFWNEGGENQRKEYKFMGKITALTPGSGLIKKAKGTTGQGDAEMQRRTSA